MKSDCVRDTSKKKSLTYMYSNRPEFKTAKFWRILEIFRNIDIHNVQVVAVHFYITPLVTYYETILESLLLSTISEVRATGQINFIFSWF